MLVFPTNTSNKNIYIIIVALNIFMISIYHDYIITEKLNLNLDKMQSSCSEMYNLVKEKFANGEDFNPVLTSHKQLYKKYNLFMYPFDEFYELRKELARVFYTHSKTTEPHYVQCWLNVYQRGDYIPYHGHWDAHENTWHGFYCVDCEPSRTTYKLPGIETPIDIPSKNNLLVMGKSQGDQHRTWPWTEKDRPRITIAFDILPRSHTDKYWLNHWVPL
jgi:hypothetical protein